MNFCNKCQPNGTMKKERLQNNSKLRIISITFNCFIASKGFCSTIVESFYNLKNGLSIITSKSSSKNLSNKNEHCMQCSGVFVVFKTKHELKCTFSGITEILWHNNWQSIFDVVKILRYRMNEIALFYLDHQTRDTWIDTK